MARSLPVGSTGLGDGVVDTEAAGEGDTEAATDGDALTDGVSERLDPYETLGDTDGEFEGVRLGSRDKQESSLTLPATPPEPYGAPGPGANDDHVTLAVLLAKDEPPPPPGAPRSTVSSDE